MGAGDEDLSARRTLYAGEVDSLNLSGRDAMPTLRAHRVQTGSHLIKVDLLLSWHPWPRADLCSRAGDQSGASDSRHRTARLRRLLRSSHPADEPSRQIAFEDRLRPIGEVVLLGVPLPADGLCPDYDHAYRQSRVVQDRGA